MFRECEFIVASRPGYSLADVANALPESLRPRPEVTKPFQKQAATGDLVLKGVTLHLMGNLSQPASATAVRQALAQGKSVCLQTNLIDHTEIPNDQTIMIYMRGHKTYKADIINKCVGLSLNTRGYSYTPTIPGSNEICSNLWTIRLNDTGQVCLVGEITPVEKAAQAK